MISIKKVSKIDSALPDIPKRKKTAAYARVSKDTKRSMDSISAQVSYYRNLIWKNPQWEYVGVYADYGITGTQTFKREGFRQMISDCEDGRIDMILTKSISRFARNTVDLLETVRYLKSLGIEVRFEKEQIYSLSEEGELMLSLLASFAQEESSSISENIKWGIRKRFKSGEIGASNKHIFGYQYDQEEKLYRIIPKEAETVRWIFDMYLQGLSLGKIADRLKAAGVCTANGQSFTESSLRSMVRNEIYAGDIRRQKYFVENPITKNKVKNQGQLPQYYMPDCHEAILDRESWAMVQKEKERRAETGNLTYDFTGKIRCSFCGNRFTRKKNSYKGRTYLYWICGGKKKGDRTCVSVNFREDELKHISAQVLGLEEFNAEVLKSEVRVIQVLEKGRLEFDFWNGRVEQWQKA